MHLQRFWLPYFYIIVCVFLLNGTCLQASDEKQWSPDFLIVGAQKAGTTSLYSYINKHPRVIKITGEMHFFDMHFHLGKEWYQSQFPQRSQPDQLVGDKSPFYLAHPLAAERVFSLFPKTKIIIVLRNPIDRAYSQYWMNRRNELEHASFEKAILLEAERIAGEKEKIIQDPTYVSYNLKRFSYLSRGLYVDQIRQWMSFFPPEQILIVLSDDLKNDTVNVMKRVFAFLNLPYYHRSEFGSKNKGKYPPMDPNFRKFLSAYFQPYNQQLEELLQIKLNWD